MQSISSINFRSLILLKLLTLSFIFCVPKFQLGDDLSLEQFRKTQTHTVLIAHSSIADNKQIKKNFFDQAFWIPTYSAVFLTTVANDSISNDLILKVSLTSLSTLKARAPPIHS